MQKIPVFKTFGNMLDSVIENLSAAFSLSWPWLLILFPIRVAGDFYLLWHGISKAKLLPAELVTFSVISLGIAILTGIAFSSIAVNWHRFILRNEVAEGTQRLRLDGMVWRYLLFAFVISLLVGLVMMGVYVGIFLVGALLYYVSKALGILIGIVVGLPLLFLVFGVWARWSVKLVAIALGNNDYGLSDAWRDTKENTWRLTGLYLLFIITLLLISLVIFGAQYFANVANSSLAAAGATGVAIIVSWFTTLMGITMLTSVYAFFVEKREP